MKCETIIKARYAETDQMGVIHHAVYPVWFEVGRTEYIKVSGLTYGELEKKGIMLPVSELTCRYLNPVKYDDEVILETCITKLSFARICFQYRVLLDGKVMATGTSMHGFVSSETFKPVNLKKVMPEYYQKLTESVESDNND